MMSSEQPSGTRIREELERRILHGIACEWEEALWILGSPYKDLMRKPLFSLRDMQRKLGYWSHERREISLARDLVLNHPWDAVREVLLHEMAHQFAQEVLGADNEPPHGPKFHRACYLLRAEPEASGNHRPLHERISHKLLGVEDKIMLRVKKLMALAESQNQHEAEAAMAKAHELIAKYNVNLMAQDENRDFVSVFLGKPVLRNFREEYALAGLLTDFYFVYGIWLPAYVVDKAKMGTVLEISGTTKNIKLAHYVYDFVHQSIDSQWDEYNKDKGLNRYRKTDFAMGIIGGFRSKLKSQTEGKTKVRNKRAVIKVEDPLLQQYVEYRYPYTRTFQREISNQDDNVLRDGIKLGKKLVISKGITERAEGRVFLLENNKC